MKGQGEFKSFLDECGILILILVLIPILSLGYFGLTHLIEYEGHRPFFCNKRYLDIFGYLSILFLLFMAIGFTIEFFKENGLKGGFRKILIFSFYIIGMIILAAIFSGNGDLDDGGREPWYENCSKC